MKNNEYKCAICSGVFKKGWTDEEANKEAKELWGVDNTNENENMSIVCDYCFHKIYPKDNLELARKHGYEK